MATIRKEVLAKITAAYTSVQGAVSNPGRIAHFYGAEEMIAIAVGETAWFLPISKSRQGRAIDDALKAILTETKVGKKIIHRVERILFLEMVARNKELDAKARAETMTPMAVQLLTKVPVTFPT